MTNLFDARKNIASERDITLVSRMRDKQSRHALKSNG